MDSLKQPKNITNIFITTKGSYGFGQKVLHEFLTAGPRKIMLLGPGQNSLAKSVAAYAGIPEVSLLQVRLKLMRESMTRSVQLP